MTTDARVPGYLVNYRRTDSAFVAEPDLSTNEPRSPDGRLLSLAFLLQAVALDFEIAAEFHNFVLERILAAKKIAHLRGELLLLEFSFQCEPELGQFLDIAPRIVLHLLERRDQIAQVLGQ